jgi:hypothetical protein
MKIHQTAMDKTEHERLLYQNLESAARDLHEEAETMCGDLRELVEIAAQGDARPEICHQIDEHLHAVIQKHIQLVAISHAVEAVYQNNSLVKQR